MGLKVRKKNSFIFLSLRIQKCMLVIFLEKYFGFMDILYIYIFKITFINKHIKKKTIIKKKKSKTKKLPGKIKTNKKNKDHKKLPSF
jgi:hypothetical protein